MRRRGGPYLHQVHDEGCIRLQSFGFPANYGEKLEKTRCGYRIPSLGRLGELTRKNLKEMHPRIVQCLCRRQRILRRRLSFGKEGRIKEREWDEPKKMHLQRRSLQRHR